MSEEAEVTQEAQSSAPEAAQEQVDTKPPGYYPVPLDNVPEEIRKPIEERFGYFMKQIGENKRTLNEYRTVAKTQAEKIEELMNGVGQVVDHLQNKSFDETEAQLRQQMKTAHESGDTDAFLTANERLTEIKAKKIALKNQPKETPKVATPEPEGDIPDLSPQDQRIVDTWQNETDESGRLLRPWAHSKNPENPLSDPQYAWALQETLAVLRNPRFANATMDQKMAEVDRRMGVTRTGSQTVMGGNLTTARKSNKLTLSSDAQKIALKIGKGKNDTEKLEWYRQQLERTKGARK